MNTKEALEKIGRDDFATLPLHDGRKIIELLKRGKKFEEMWGELEMYVEGTSEALTHKMDILWQKYIIEKEVNND